MSRPQFSILFLMKQEEREKNEMMMEQMKRGFEEADHEGHAWTAPLDLQHWLQLTYERERVASVKKQSAAREQFDQAREMVRTSTCLSLFRNREYNDVTKRKDINKFQREPNNSRLIVVLCKGKICCVCAPNLYSVEFLNFIISRNFVIHVLFLSVVGS